MYKYYDMHQVIAEALKTARRELISEIDSCLCKH